MNFIASRAKVESSTTIEISDRVKELRRKGEDVINLSVGEPDFVTPEHIREHAKQALDEGHTFYPETAGLWELREAIAQKLLRENNVEADPKKQILVTVGGKEAIYTAIMATVNPGDEVIVSDPAWVSYVPYIKLAEGRPVYFPVRESEQFRISGEDLEKVVTNKTKMLIINTPNNPTGSVLSKSDLESIADLAKRKKFLVLSDELYEKIVYDGETHCSIASIDGMEDFAIVVNGFSKSMAMTGWRLGYMCAPRTIIERITAIHSHLVTGPCTFAQRAAALALHDPRTEESIREMVAEYARRREIVASELAKLKEISCFRPRGTFYAFPNVSRLGLKSLDLARELVDKAKVAVVPGDAFGLRGEGFIRISFAASRDKLKTAFERIRQVLFEIEAGTARRRI